MEGILFVTLIIVGGIIFLGATGVFKEKTKGIAKALINK